MSDLNQFGALIRQNSLREYLGIPVSTFQKMKNRPGFPRPHKTAVHRSGAVYYKKADVQKWLDGLASDAA